MRIDGSTLLAILMLASVMVVAAVCDLRTRRIPNLLVLTGLFLASGWHVLARAGSWSFDPRQPGSTGLWGALSAFAIMLIVFAPLNALRVLGAGDVKLMGVVGAFFGASPKAWTHLIEVSLVIFVCGGLVSLLILRQQGFNGRVPYGVAIAIGALLFACARALGTSWPA